MEYKVIISGFGGQGVLFAGKLLALAAMYSGKHVSWLPSYGPEMRGGTANCRVVISDEEISSPAFNKADALIAFNKPALTRFGTLADLIITSDNAAADYHGTKQLCRCTVGSDSPINMVLLGEFIRHENLLAYPEIKAAVKEMSGRNADCNLAAMGLK